MRVPCYICEQLNCYDCFFQKICKKCSNRLTFIPARSDHDTIREVRSMVAIKLAEEGYNT